MTRSGIPGAAWLVLLLAACAGKGSGADAGPEASSEDITTCNFEADGFCPSGEICNLKADCERPNYLVGSGTVTDEVTGLIWQEPTASDPCPGDDMTGVMGQCTFADAQSYCQNLSLGVYNTGSWRLPADDELFSLVEFGAALPNVDQTVFPSTVSNFYWTSTAYPDGGYWLVDFGGGYALDSEQNADGGVISVEWVRCVH